MEDEKYNGYVNFETWALSLHLNQTKDIQSNAKEVISNYELGIDKDRALKDWITGLQEEVIYENDTTDDLKRMIKDIGSIWRINFKEVVDDLESD